MAAENNNDYIMLAQIYTILNEKNLPNKKKAVLKVLEQKADINYKVPNDPYFTAKKPMLIGCTALHLALRKCDLDVFQQLLKCKADFTLTDINGNTVLHKMMEESYVKHKKCWELKGKLEHPFVDLVLNAHIERKNGLNPWNKHGISHFHVACMFNHPQAVEFFIKCVVSPDSEVPATSLILPGYTALHFAARYCSEEVAIVLMNYCANPYERDAKSYTPLHVLIERNLELLDYMYIQKENPCEKLTNELNSNRRMIKLLFEYMRTDVDNIGLTILHIASILGDLTMAQEVIQLISIDNIVYKDSPFWAGYTSLHFAARTSMDMVKLLIKHGGNVTIKAVDGVMPLDLCMERFGIEDVHYIMTNTALLNSIRFTDNVTELSNFILSLQDEQMLKVLLDTVPTNEIIPLTSPLWPGYSMLHLAILFCDRVNILANPRDSSDYFETNFENADYLLKLFKNDYEEEKTKWYLQRILQIFNVNENLLNQKNVQCSTPLHLAFRLQNRSVIKLLLEKQDIIGEDIVDQDGLSFLHIICAMRIIDEPLALRLLTAEQKADVNRTFPDDVQFLVTDEYPEETLVFFSTPGSKPLHLAIGTDNSTLAMLLLEYGADIEARDSEGFTPLHRLFQLDDCFDIGVNLLSGRSLKNDCVTRFGLNYLHVACLLGCEESIENLLELGVDIESTYSLPEYSNVHCNRKHLEERSHFKQFIGYTPLYIATFMGYFDIVELLIERGANIYAKNAYGCAVLTDLIFRNTSRLRSKFLETFFKEGELFFEKLHKDIGLTQFHVDCFNPDKHKIRSMLMNNKADANQHVSSNSLIWSQKSSLHFLVMLMKNNWPINIERRIGWLIHYGADVTLQDENQSTPVHLAFALFFCEDEESNDQDAKYLDPCYCPSALIAGQKNFTINPFDIRGVSHFHIACVCNNVENVKKFLKYGVDINCQVNFFCERYGGFTPLHFAAYHNSRETVQLLLKHGANVHAKDSLGNTPLHVAAYYCHGYSHGCGSEKIFEMLIDSAANVNSQNVWGETALCVFMKSGNTTHRGIEILVANGTNCVNIFNSKNEGLVAYSLSWHSRRTIQKNSVYKAIMRNLEENKIDPFGRTVIHNIVATGQSGIRAGVYTFTIDSFMKANIDIDQRDHKGWTAVHTALSFGNLNGFLGLWQNGADIWLTDLNKKSPIEVYIEHNDEDSVHRRDFVYQLLLITQLYNAAKLEIRNADKEIIELLSREYVLDEDELQKCNKEFSKLKSERVGSTGITWFAVLSHTKRLFRILRENPAEGDTSFNWSTKTIRAKFPFFAGLLIMQYRKALQRIPLIDSAKHCFDIINNGIFPHLCFDYIIPYLRNDDLQSLITAMEHELEKSKFQFLYSSE